MLFYNWILNALKLSNAKWLRAKFSKWYLLHIHISTPAGQIGGICIYKEESIQMEQLLILASFGGRVLLLGV